MGMPPSSSSVSLQHVMQPSRILHRCTFREICSLLSLPTTALRSSPPVLCGLRLGLPSGTTALGSDPVLQTCRQGALPCPCSSPSPPRYLPTRDPRVSPAQLKRGARYRILGHLELAHKSSSIGPVPWADPFHRTLTRPPSSQEQPPRWAGRTTPRIPMPPPSGP